MGWLAIPPSNDRDWQPDLKTLAWAKIAGDRITFHNIRNCEYRTEKDFCVHTYDRTFDLTKLRQVDCFLVYWGSPHIAHTMVSFNFVGQGILCFSAETRKEKGEDYSTIKGFFRQYEMIYVVADERDVIRLRTNYRKEDVYLYRLKMTPEDARMTFINYISELNRLRNRPEWYNALIDNCTTGIYQNFKPYGPFAWFDWRIIFNGHIDQLIYERGLVDNSMPFQELKRRSYINPVAQAAETAPDFSRRIRMGLPGM